MAKTGEKVYTLLIEYDAKTGLPTGRTKPNLIGDPNYIPPVYDPLLCPINDTPIVDRIVTLVMEGSFTFTLKLIQGTFVRERSNPGNWSVPDITYDKLIVEVTSAPNPFQLKVLYGEGVGQQIQLGSLPGTYLFNGPFISLASVEISGTIENNGDFSDDFNTDYFI